MQRTLTLLSFIFTAAILTILVTEQIHEPSDKEAKCIEVNRELNTEIQVLQNDIFTKDTMNRHLMRQILLDNNLYYKFPKSEASRLKPLVSQQEKILLDSISRLTLPTSLDTTEMKAVTRALTLFKDWGIFKGRQDILNKIK